MAEMQASQRSPGSNVRVGSTKFRFKYQLGLKRALQSLLLALLRHADRNGGKEDQTFHIASPLVCRRGQAAVAVLRDTLCR